MKRFFPCAAALAALWMTRTLHGDAIALMMEPTGASPETRNLTVIMGASPAAPTATAAAGDGLPEPATLACGLLALGAMGIALARRRLS